MKVFKVIKGKKLTVDVNMLINFTPKRIDKIKLAIEYVEKILNSVEFRDQFMKLKFKGNDKNCNGPTYELLMSGKSNFGGADGDMDLSLTYYYSRWSRVIGYGYPSSIKTWVNGKYFDYMSAYELAAHLVHEYIHKLGFDDDYGSLSVPYQTGYLVERLGKFVYNGGSLTELEVEASI